MVDLSQINDQIFSSFSLSGIISGLGLVILGIIVIGGFAGWYWWYWSKKQFNRFTTDFELIGDTYEPIPERRDRAKLVRLGKGGFQLLFLRKQKVYRIAFGGRIGRKAHYFFIGQDGYPYNCILGNEITTEGRIPIKTTNPLMRAQYTALEKMVDDLSKTKTAFWDKYGNWVLSIAFVLIIGVIAWLIYREMNSFWGSASSIMNQLSEMIKEVRLMRDAVPINPNSGITQAG